MALTHKAGLISTGLLLFLFNSCTPAKSVTKKAETLYPVTEPPETLLSKTPNYDDILKSAAGRARAVVSEPGNSERVTLYFETDERLSMMTIKNRMGIEGGQILVDKDSILIYDKTEQFAQKTSVLDARLTGLNELASINFLDLLNFKITAGQTASVMQNNSQFVFFLKDGSTVYIRKGDGTVSKVEQDRYSGLPYSVIEYDSYASIDGFTLPKKITIFSSDRTSRVNLQILELNINPQKLNLTLNIPKNITIERP